MSIFKKNKKQEKEHLKVSISKEEIQVIIKNALEILSKLKTARRTIKRIKIYFSNTLFGNKYDVFKLSTCPLRTSRGGFKYKGKSYTKETKLPTNVRTSRGLGLKDFGWHYIIMNQFPDYNSLINNAANIKNGTIEEGLKISLVSKLEKAKATSTINVLIIGTEYSITYKQLLSLRSLILALVIKYTTDEINLEIVSDNELLENVIIQSIKNITKNFDVKRL